MHTHSRGTEGDELAASIDEGSGKGKEIESGRRIFYTDPLKRTGSWPPAARLPAAGGHELVRFSGSVY
jgi:hypothetical protein